MTTIGRGPVVARHEATTTSSTTTPVTTTEPAVPATSTVPAQSATTTAPLDRVERAPVATTTATPSASTTTRGTAAALVGRVAQDGAVTTPKFNLKAAVADPTFAARDPGTIDRPALQPILDAIGRAQTIVLIGHVAPDGDCVGTTLAMARALEKRGKTVEVCVDDDLTGSLRAIDSEQKVRRAAQLKDRRWDLALIMDVAQPDRIGHANDLLLPHAGEVAIVDHHVVDPRREQFDLAPGAPFTTWVEPDYPAAALMAAALLARIGVDDEERKRVYLPALAGFATDTGFGNFQGLDKEWFRYFKHMMLDSAKSSMEELERSIEYALPKDVVDKLLTQNGDGLREEHVGKLAVLDVDASCVARLLAEGRRSDPNLIDQDLLNVLKWNRVRGAQKAGAEVTAFLIENDDGAIFLSTRANDPRARELAEHMGGGGHDHAAGARIDDLSLEQARAKVIAWADAKGLT